MKTTLYLGKNGLPCKLDNMYVGIIEDENSRNIVEAPTIPSVVSAIKSSKHFQNLSGGFNIRFLEETLTLKKKEEVPNPVGEFPRYVTKITERKIYPVSKKEHEEFARFIKS